ncbi:PAS domain S-box protein [Halovenus sp. WSH3]|uniref:histidine kinase n=1 Tax=Halovenus carboxidivorans TaxID=2692199 RepID=A0A6B0TF62_9EURY|nr:PAS domain-containing sensor histidine kinase [Halovenus carboxidivorans]MXR51829.1 PAS domain S-box protein [Halovenus carboxidivorans]
MSEEQGSAETGDVESRSGDYSHLVEEAEDGLYMLDSEGRFELLNSAFAELTGYDREELIGEDPRLVLADGEVERFNRQIRSAIASEETSGSMLTTVVTKTSQRKPVEIRFSLLPTDDGEYNGLTGVARDVRARRHREQKLDVLSRVLRHNVRNRLNLIFGHAATLKDADDQHYRRAAEKIEAAAEELMELSEKARTAQTEVGFNPSEHNQTDVTELIEHLAVQLRREYPQVNLKLDLPPELIVNVPKSYRIAVNELVENAIEHNPDPEPVVRIRIERTEATVRTVVEDECPPIPDSDRRAINEGKETPLMHSLGIGLWLANWVADTVGGELELDRREDDSGNTAVIVLPHKNRL